MIAFDVAKGSLTLAFCLCVLGVLFTIECVFMSLSVTKTHSVATDGETNTQNEHAKRQCN
jgi:hypothetical protein